jgi:predicted adenylyl cyclase CyaB
MKQCDYYFTLGADKEKLRVIDDTEYQLITYRRLEKRGRKDSHYDIKVLDVGEKDALLNFRKVIKQVNKTRDLWLYENTRIHVDRVEHLGDFLELETVIRNISLKAGESEFKAVVNRLHIDTASSVPASYSDLVPAFA